MRTLVVVLAAAVVAVAGPRRAAADPAAAGRALVATWLDAQNHGKLGAYAALYANGFHGTKRVGKHTRTMDRAAWLRDRKKMFRAPMKVTADDVTVTATPAAVVVELRQTWSQGDFADTGKKRLTLDPAGTHIVREDMLDSRVLLTEGACLTQIYPGGSWARRRTEATDGLVVVDVTVLDLGAHSVCAVEVDGGTNRVVTVAVLAYRRGWRKGGTRELSYPHELAEDTEENGAVNVSTVDVSDREPVVQIWRQEHRRGPESDETTEQTTLYRLGATDLTELVSFDSSSSGGEADSSSRCELKIEPRKHQGWHDLTLTCTESSDDWHGDAGHQESHTTTRYRWDGDTYEEI